MVSTLAFLALQTPTVDPSIDPALAKPVTIRLALRPVKEIVKAVAAASGADLAVATPVADLKATVLVKALPAGRTLEALADALGLAWRKETGGGYRLFRTPEATKAIDAYAADERARYADTTKEAVKGAERNVVLADGTAQVEVIARGPRGGRVRRGGATAPASYVRFDPSLLAVETARSEPPTRLEPAAPSGDGTFARANVAWATIEKSPSPDWNKGLRPVTLPASTWENGSYALSDLLLAWHDATDMPVVADAFRVSMKALALPQTRALASLQGLAQGDRLALRLANGVARLRHPAYWRLRDQEVPESAWRSLESSKQPTLGDYASFASGLTVPQAAAFRSLEAPLSHVPTEAVRQAYPALRLWSSLSGQVQSALLAGRAVPVSALGGTDSYVFALREAPYYRSGDPTQALAMNAAQLGLFATASGKQVALRLGPARGGGPEYVIALP